MSRKVSGLEFFFFLEVLEFELRALLARQALHCLIHSTSPFFVMGFFKIGSPELFAQGWPPTVILPISTS
jgi:hypothetical protein